MALLFKDAPNRSILTENYLNQVIIRFDFPIILGIATTDESGDLVTARQSKLLEEVQQQLGARLPVYSQSQAQRLNVDLSDPSAPKFRQTKDTPAHQFTSLNKNRLCEITASSFTYLAKGKPTYESFEKFVEEFWETWTIVQRVMSPRALTRIGVRKVNNFQLSEGGDLWETLKEKVKDQFLPPVHISSKALFDYSARQTFGVESSPIVCVCQGAFRRSMEGINKPVFVLDFDVFDSSVISTDSVSEKINNMNKILWELFWYSIKPEHFTKILKSEKKAT